MTYKENRFSFGADIKYDLKDEKRQVNAIEVLILRPIKEMGVEIVCGLSKSAT